MNIPVHISEIETKLLYISSAPAHRIIFVILTVLGIRQGAQLAIGAMGRGSGITSAPESPFFMWQGFSSNPQNLAVFTSSSAIIRENSSWSYFRVAWPPNSLGRFSTSKNVFMSSTLSLPLGYTNFTFWNVLGSRKYLTAYRSESGSSSNDRCMLSYK